MADLNGQYVLLVSLQGDIDAHLSPSYEAALADLRDRASRWEELDNPRPELDRITASEEQLSKLFTDSMDPADTWCKIIPIQPAPLWK